MKDLKSPGLMFLKAALFVLIAAGASASILLAQRNLRTAGLLALAIWGSCRAYYFCFYVIERYIDPTFRFSGLFSALRYLVATRKR